jgi:hypothetical protein
VQPERVRFRAQALQSDMNSLRDGLRATIVPPMSSGVPPETSGDDAMWGPLAIGWQGDPDDRTIDLYVAPERLASWARVGVTAQLEIEIDASAAAELAIPVAAVARDGLMPIVFRRDPGNGDQAIRLEADLGMSDGRWVVINSGVAKGDEVVVHGVYQLLLATSDNAAQGGHFHADGTFHADDEEHEE